MKKQYYHKMIGNFKYTAVVDVPTKDEMVQVLGLNLFHKLEVTIKCGYAIVNPKDRYVKKIGRETADNRAESFKFKVVNMDTVAGHSMIDLISVDDDCPVISLCFDIKHDRTKIHLIKVRLNNNLRK